MPLNDEILVEEATATYRLEDLDVKEVSVVDRGANKRKLLVVKNAEVPMSKDALENTGADEAVEPAVTPDPVVDAQAEKAKAATELIVSLPEGVRDSVGKALTELSTRLGALGEAVKASAPGEGGLSDKFKAEMTTLSFALRSLGGVDKSTTTDAIDKSLMAEGHPIAQAYAVDYTKTVPEVVMTSEGPMMKMPMEAMKGMACKYAMEKLYEAEDALYQGDMGGCCVSIYAACKAMGPFVPDDSGMPQQMAMAMKMFLGKELAMETMKQYAFNQPQPSIPAGVPDSHLPANMEKPGSGSSGDLAKAGRKLNASDLGKFEEIFAKLGAVLEGLRPKDVAKAEDGEEQINPQLKETMLSMAKIIKNLEAENKELRSSRPVGNAMVNEGDDKPSSNKVTWPDDLNEPTDSDLDY